MQLCSETFDSWKYLWHKKKLLEHIYQCYQLLQLTVSVCFQYVSVHYSLMVHHVWHTMYPSHIIIFGKAVRVERGQSLSILAV